MLKYPNKAFKFELDKKSQEYKDIKDKTQTGTIVGVLRIQHANFYLRYTKEKERLCLKLGAGNIREIYGYHGTREVHPDQILSSPEGFDVKYARSGGMYNAGLYFAMQSRYSLNGYSFRNQDRTRTLFYCQFMLGKEFDSNIWRRDRDKYQDHVYKMQRLDNRQSEAYQKT